MQIEITETNGKILSVTLPGGALDADMFAGNTDILSVKLPDGLIIIPECTFMGCENLQQIGLPTGLASIGDGAFVGCSSLQMLSLPETLREIGSISFFGCGLRTIVVPKAVQTIGENAFKDCLQLEAAEVLGTETILGHNVFDGCRRLRSGRICGRLPDNPEPEEELLFALLYCTCDEQEYPCNCRWLEEYVSRNEEKLMEAIVSERNTKALEGLLNMDLLRKDHTMRYVKQTNAIGCPELTALLLGNTRDDPTRETEFELDDFSSPEEFMKWKAWSDESYAEIDHGDRQYYAHKVPLFEQETATESTEDAIIGVAERKQQEVEDERMLAEFLRMLTPVQKRRFVMYFGDRMSLMEIAEIEGTHYTSVQESITAIRRKISRFKCKQSVKTPLKNGDFSVLSESGDEPLQNLENLIDSVKGTKPV